MLQSTSLYSRSSFLARQDSYWILLLLWGNWASKGWVCSASGVNESYRASSLTPTAGRLPPRAWLFGGVTASLPQAQPLPWYWREFGQPRSALRPWFAFSLGLPGGWRTVLRKGMLLTPAEKYQICNRCIVLGFIAEKHRGSLFEELTKAVWVPGAVNH